MGAVGIQLRFELEVMTACHWIAALPGLERGVGR